MSRIIGTDAALVASTVVAVTLSGLALSGYSLGVSATAAPAPSPSSSSSSSSSSSDSSSTGSADPSTKASPSVAPTAQRATVATLPTDRAASLVVVGDSTSNDTTEWVNALGNQFGTSRTTQVRRVNQADGTSYNDPMHYGTEDPRLDIWNVSAAPAIVINDESIAPLIGSAPSLVLLSQGRDAGEDPTEGLATTVETIQQKYPKAPIAVVLEPDLLDGSRKDALAAIRIWAGERGLATIDVAAAFTAAGNRAEPSDYQMDDGQLTAAGHDLWAVTVHKATAER